MWKDSAFSLDVLVTTTQITEKIVLIPLLIKLVPGVVKQKYVMAVH